jgi:hypothetical protein
MEIEDIRKDKTSAYGIPLSITTDKLDIEEGIEIEKIRALAVEQHVDEEIDVPTNLERNVMVTSLDALLDWEDLILFGQ